MNIKMILFVVILSHGITAIAQVDTSSVLLKKNSLQGNLTFYGLGGGATGAYERILLQKILNTNISLFAKIGYGADEGWGLNGPYYLPQIGILKGKSKNYLEIGLGVVIVDQGYRIRKYPHPTIGYRRQKPGKNIMFRTGLSNPEGLYAGFGYSF